MGTDFRRGRRWTWPIVVAFALSWLCALPASAQYFGQNKVQYKKLDFQILTTAHFDIYYYPEEREGIDIAARMAERWHARLERLFDHQLRGRQPLVLTPRTPISSRPIRSKASSARELAV